MAAPKFRTKREFSPIGMLLHCHVNKPDSKFNPEKPRFKTKLVLEADDGQAFKAKLEALLEQAWTAESADMKPADLKKWAKAPLPIDEELNDQDEPTGRLIFKFGQNARIKMKDGSVKDISIAIVDSKGKPAGKLKVFSGTMARVGYATRSYPKADGKLIGLTLDFDIVKVIKPSTRTMDTGPDDEGWTAEDGDNDFDDTASENTKAPQGDGEGSGDF